MLKKVICLLLVLACSTVLFACVPTGTANTNPPVNNSPSVNNNTNKNPSSGNQNTDKNESGDKEFIDNNTTVDTYKDQAFFAMIQNSNPNVITTRTTVNNSKLGEAYGFYRTTIFGADDYSFYYEYDKFNEIGAKDRIEHVGPSTIYYKDGAFSSDGEHPDSDVLNAKLDVNRQYLGNYKLSGDGTSLETKITAANAEKVFGVKIAATSSVKLVIETNGTYLSKITVEYTNNDSSVYIETSYTYENISNSAE